MTIIRVRLDDEDRKRYGGDQPLAEWLVLDTEKLKDLPADELDRLEHEIDIALAGLLPHLEPRLGKLAFMRRAAVFLAVRQAGHSPAWDDFQPRLLRAEFVQEDEANPPAGPSEVSSEG